MTRDEAMDLVEQYGSTIADQIFGPGGKTFEDATVAAERRIVDAIMQAERNVATWQNVLRVAQQEFPGHTAGRLRDWCDRWDVDGDEHRGFDVLRAVADALDGGVIAPITAEEFLADFAEWLQEKEHHCGECKHWRSTTSEAGICTAGYSVESASEQGHCPQFEKALEAHNEPRLPQ